MPCRRRPGARTASARGRGGTAAARPARPRDAPARMAAAGSPRRAPARRRSTRRGRARRPAASCRASSGAPWSSTGTARRSARSPSARAAGGPRGAPGTRSRVRRRARARSARRRRRRARGCGPGGRRSHARREHLRRAPRARRSGSCQKHRGPGVCRARRSFPSLLGGWLHHPAHVGHPAAAAAAAAVLLGRLGDDRLGGEDVLGDRGRVLQRRARHHRRVDDAGRDEVDDLAAGGVEALALLRLADVVDDDRALEAGVLRDLAGRLLERAQDDLRAGLLILVAELIEVDRRGGLEQRHAAARHDALLEGRAGRLQRVLDAVLLLLHLRLGGRADLHDGDAAGELGEALLELLAIEVRVGVLDLRLDLVDAALDGVGRTGAVDDRRRVLRDHDAAGPAELRDLGVLELEAHLLGDDLAAGEDRDVLEHALAAVAEARSLNRDAGEGAAQLVDHERREGLALDVLGDDQQRLAGLDDLLEHRQDVADRADLLVGDEDVGILEHGLHAVLVGDHVGRDVALVELHALGELEVHAERLALLDVDHAVLADLLDGVGDHVADLVVAGGNRRHAGDLILAGDLLRLLADVVHDLVDGALDAALEAERVRAGGDVLEALADDRLGEDRRRRGAVARDVVGRRGDLAHELGALVLEDVLDLDLTSDRDTVVGDG